MAKQNVAEQFVDILVARRRPADVRSRRRQPQPGRRRHPPNGGIEWIQVRHEEDGAFAAGAEAQITGRLAACAGCCGPGNLHLINGLYDAHRSMAPVLALAVHIPSSEIGLGYFQETHPDQLFQRVQPLQRADLQPRQMPRLLQTAIQHGDRPRRRSVRRRSPGDIASLPAPEKPIVRAHLVAAAAHRAARRRGDREAGRLVDEADRSRCSAAAAPPARTPR